MNCPDKSSNIILHLDENDCIIFFHFSKSLCGNSISLCDKFSEYCKGKNLNEISSLSFEQLIKDLNENDDEAKFIFFIEFDALQTLIATYQGTLDESADTDRCSIVSIEHENVTKIEAVLLPQLI